MTNLETAMIVQIIDALGVTGKANAENMAMALIIQLGQDYHEMHALLDDLRAEGLTQVLEYPYGIITQMAPQSADVKLASLGAEFPYDAIKEGTCGQNTRAISHHIKRMI
jgi:hypothetical protein